MLVVMQGKWNNIIRLSGLALLMLLLCLPCFAKQTIKQSWGFPVTEGKASNQVRAAFCNYSDNIFQQVKQEVVTKGTIPFRTHHFDLTDKVFVTFQLKDYQALLHKPYLNPLHILFQQFRI